jgi:hypothetical protein
MSRLISVTTDLFKNEGPRALYKGITPRVLRVAPGQAIVFTVSLHLIDSYMIINQADSIQVYERVKKWIDQTREQYHEGYDH